MSELVKGVEQLQKAADLLKFKLIDLGAAQRAISLIKSSLEADNSDVILEFRAPGLMKKVVKATSAKPSLTGSDLGPLWLELIAALETVIPTAQIDHEVDGNVFGE